MSPKIKTKKEFFTLEVGPGDFKNLKIDKDGQENNAWWLQTSLLDSFPHEFSDLRKPSIICMTPG